MQGSLERLLRAEGVDGSWVPLLAVYGELVLSENRRINLTGAKSPEAFVEQLLDSLTLAPYVSGSLVDVGSGAGLPGIPLAIAKDIDVTMVEATAKKARFLERAVAALGIRGTIVAERAEIAAHRDELRERFAAGTGRAVASGTATAELVVPFLRIGGEALLQRGAMSDDDRAALADAALVLGADLREVAEAGPGREIAIIVKGRPTPHRFPRRTGIPTRRPICDNVSRET